MYCKNCDQLITGDKRNIFCSRSCAASLNNTAAPKRGPEGSCALCSTPISAARKYCKGCWYERSHSPKPSRPARKPVRRAPAKPKTIKSPVDEQLKRQRYNEYMKQYMRDRWRRRREEAIVALGGQCKNCGSTVDLEFDHIDPAEKDFTIGSASSYSEVQFQAELLKCQLLCKKCHIDKHRTKYPCGTTQKYWSGCRCADCTKANSDYCKDYRRRLKSFSHSDTPARLCF